MPLKPITHVHDARTWRGDIPISSRYTAGIAGEKFFREIKDYARKLIDVVGKDGGFIMSSNTVLDDADPERVKLWIDFTREYGMYQ